MAEFDIGDIVTYKADSGWGKQTFRISDFSIRKDSYLAYRLDNGEGVILEYSDIILDPCYEKKKTFKQQLEKL